MGGMAVTIVLASSSTRRADHREFALSAPNSAVILGTEPVCIDYISDTNIPCRRCETQLSYDVA